MPFAGHAHLYIYDVAGRLVARPVDGMLKAGPHHITWDGTNMRGQQVASGVYFYRLRVAGRSSLTKKMVLLK